MVERTDGRERNDGDPPKSPVRNLRTHDRIQPIDHPRPLLDLHPDLISFPRECLDPSLRLSDIVFGFPETRIHTLSATSRSVAAVKGGSRSRLALGGSPFRFVFVSVLEGGEEEPEPVVLSSLSG